MLLISILVKHTTAVLIGDIPDVIGDMFLFCSSSIPLKLWNLGVSLRVRLERLTALVGVFSFESVPESVSKLRSLSELLQLSVSAMRLARLFRARLEVDEVV